MHIGSLPGGERFELSVEDATLQLGYLNVEVLTADVIARVERDSHLTASYFAEALRLDGVYAHDSDSVLFVADEKWLR